jgi:hypothetical protein
MSDRKKRTNRNASTRVKQPPHNTIDTLREGRGGLPIGFLSACIRHGFKIGHPDESGNIAFEKSFKPGVTPTIWVRVESRNRNRNTPVKPAWVHLDSDWYWIEPQLPSSQYDREEILDSTAALRHNKALRHRGNRVGACTNSRCRICAGKSTVNPDSGKPENQTFSPLNERRKAEALPFARVIGSQRVTATLAELTARRLDPTDRGSAITWNVVYFPSRTPQTSGVRAEKDTAKVNSHSGTVQNFNAPIENVAVRDVVISKIITPPKGEEE